MSESGKLGVCAHETFDWGTPMVNSPTGKKAYLSDTAKIVVSKTQVSSMQKRVEIGGLG